MTLTQVSVEKHLLNLVVYDKCLSAYEFKPRQHRHQDTKLSYLISIAVGLLTENTNVTDRLAVS